MNLPTPPECYGCNPPPQEKSANRALPTYEEQKNQLIEQNTTIRKLNTQILDLQRPALQARISNQRKQIEELLTKIARMAGKKCVYIASLRNENAKLQSDLAASKDYAENLCRLQESADSRMRQACFDEVLASFHRPGKGVSRKPSGNKLGSSNERKT